MSSPLSLGYSPCPNDTFIFYALTHGRIALPGIRISERLADVETLNQLALAGVLDLTKVSYHAFGHLRDEYLLLRSGGALGRGCGPLVVAPQALAMADLKGRRIAIPGRLTTANLLLQLYGEGFEELLILPFEQVMPAVLRGEAAAGVIIHESRFTFHQLGLHQVLDLGAWWEAETGLPIPLGGILARRELGPELIQQLEGALTASIDYAYAHPMEPRSYIKRHSQELADAVIDQHIDLYVNDFSRTLGPEGERAVTELLRRAEARGIIPTSPQSLFCN
ncbi:1,4-dihydroxy-6-naphthoate synthase [Desulfuromonas carbonis]|uniref:1,4-dihydroxy-6-naphthoate synthase n=1 Tax=Desulfuromonas sp. DDH964 TaxID=1823759 RepID=UPI00078EF7B3|nr:1,4-dihydroxy-6-naphthoate synthase [Desulfuromonas sp. DDH964]AMV73912.1 1,4-dihydroxy-6-naphthoate synthase [Desulfuromonas sp. DDH964]